MANDIVAALDHGARIGNQFHVQLVICLDAILAVEPSGSKQVGSIEESLLAPISENQPPPESAGTSYSDVLHKSAGGDDVRPLVGRDRIDRLIESRQQQVVAPHDHDIGSARVVQPPVVSLINATGFLFNDVNPVQSSFQGIGDGGKASAGHDHQIEARRVAQCRNRG